MDVSPKGHLIAIATAGKPPPHLFSNVIDVWDALNHPIRRHQGSRNFNVSGSGADPGFFLGGGSLVSCSTSTPINHIVFFWQNTSCFRKPQVISGEWGVRTPCTLPLDPPLWISGETLNGVFDIASQIITTSHRNSKIKFAKLVLSCQPVLWNIVYGTSVVDSHVFMFDMTGNKSCKLLKKRGL